MYWLWAMGKYATAGDESQREENINVCVQFNNLNRKQKV